MVTFMRPFLPRYMNISIEDIMRAKINIPIRCMDILSSVLRRDHTKERPLRMVLRPGLGTQKKILNIWDLSFGRTSLTPLTILVLNAIQEFEVTV